MVKVHINNTKHITIANICIPPRDNTSTHYKTADTDIQHCLQDITNIPHSVLTGDVNAHSTLWHSYTNDHKGKLMADVTLQQTSSPDITTVSNTLYNWTSWTTQHALSSDYNKTDGHSPTRRNLTEHRVRFRSDHQTHQYTHCQQNFHKHTDGRQAQYTKGKDA